MVRRSLAIAVVSLALSAAAALAFAPSGTRAGRAGRELLGAAFGYTPIEPDSRSGFGAEAQSREPTETAGAFCAVRLPAPQQVGARAYCFHLRLQFVTGATMPPPARPRPAHDTEHTTAHTSARADTFAR